MDLITDINKKVNESDESETSAKFKKGQHVKRGGKEYVVEVPDAKTDFVGIVPVGKEGDKEAVDLVRATELTIKEEYKLLKGFTFTD